MNSLLPWTCVLFSIVQVCIFVAWRNWRGEACMLLASPTDTSNTRGSAPYSTSAKDVEIETLKGALSSKIKETVTQQVEVEKLRQQLKEAEGEIAVLKRQGAAQLNANGKCECPKCPALPECPKCPAPAPVECPKCPAPPACPVAPAATQSSTAVWDVSAYKNYKGQWKSIGFYSVWGDVPLGTKGQWHGQFAQDWRAVSVFGCKQGGFFLDLAANLAMQNSNTLILERDFGFEGICFEANPQYWWALFHRKCRLYAGAVGEPDTSVQFEPHAETSGIVGKNFDRAFASASALRYHTASLPDILERFQAPSIIDYFSLDVEGAESMIMKGFPHDKYVFHILNVERPKKDLMDQLEKNGYVLLRNVYNWEKMYVHRSIPDFDNIMKTWQGESNLDLPASCMDKLGYKRPKNEKWPR